MGERSAAAARDRGLSGHVNHVAGRGIGIGALTWPGGIDLAPDAMYQRIRESGTSTLAAKSRKVA
jgi:hypothetical protein